MVKIEITTIKIEISEKKVQFNRQVHPVSSRWSTNYTPTKLCDYQTHAQCTRARVHEYALPYAKKTIAEIGSIVFMEMQALKGELE